MSKEYQEYLEWKAAGEALCDQRFKETRSQYKEYLEWRAALKACDQQLEETRSQYKALVDAAPRANDSKPDSDDIGTLLESLKASIDSINSIKYDLELQDRSNSYVHSIEDKIAAIESKLKYPNGLTDDVVSEYVEANIPMGCFVLSDYDGYVLIGATNEFTYCLGRDPTYKLSKNICSLHIIRWSNDESEFEKRCTREGIPIQTYKASCIERLVKALVCIQSERFDYNMGELECSLNRWDPYAD